MAEFCRFEGSSFADRSSSLGAVGIRPAEPNDVPRKVTGAKRGPDNRRPLRSRWPGLASSRPGPKLFAMFVVDDATADTLHRIWQEEGELSALVELRRHFPLIADNARARLCLQAIVGWAPRSAPEPGQD